MQKKFVKKYVLLPFLVAMSLLIVGCQAGEDGKDGADGKDGQDGKDYTAIEPGVIPGDSGAGLHVINQGGGYYPGNHLEGQEDATHDDPKTTRAKANIKYELDDVENLSPGTYVAFIEAAKYGRLSASDYMSPTTMSVTFQVGTASVQPNVAENCKECHGSAYLHVDRHKTEFKVDNCTACHNYQNGPAPAGSLWQGAAPLSKRVHAIHFGSSLNDPFNTIGYMFGFHSWNKITMPQDVRNCEKCHEDRVSGATASDAWKDNPNRLACLGCHDSPFAIQHATAQTVDPTPSMPYSGDEQESCMTCHASGKDFAVDTFHGAANSAQAAYGINNSANLCTTVDDVTVTGSSVQVDLSIAASGADLTPCTSDDVAETGVAAADMRFYLGMLIPESASSQSMWVSYINTEQEVGATSASWPAATGSTGADGDTMNQATYESASSGTWVDNNDGTYTYTFAAALGDITIDRPANKGAVANNDTTNQTTYTYDASYTHRVAVQLTGGANNAPYDFVPDGASALETREIVTTATCNDQCHDTLALHGGGRLEVELCVVCHNPTTGDPHSGNQLDMMNMVHKIHMGRDLPNVEFNRSTYQVDGKEYAIWGYRNSKHDYSYVGFPPMPTDCAACHDGSGADSDNYKNSWNDACYSCHDQEDYASGVTSTGGTHTGGSRADDAALSDCTTCHPASGTTTAAISPVTTAHEDYTWGATENEFDATITVSDPTNDEYFQAGEKPVITVDLGVADHTKVKIPTYNHAYLFVTGPRSNFNPVLTTMARAEVFSTDAGPWDFSEATGIRLVVDKGYPVTRVGTSGAFTGVPLTTKGPITIAVPAAPAEGETDSFAKDRAKTTAAEVVAWLNANADFSTVAMAEVTDDGMVTIRSRNLGKVYSVELLDSDVTKILFGTPDVMIDETASN